MDVVTAEQAKIAEDAGAVAVMALERVPADIRRDGGVARMSDPALIEGIKAAVTIPVMAKARIGHFAEAQVLESLGVDYIDESEVLTPADEANHIDKWALHRPVRVRRHQPGRGAAPHLRGRGHDPLQGRGRAPATSRRRCATCGRITGDIRKITQADSGRALRVGQAAAGAGRRWSRRWPRPAGCRCRCSAPAASPRRRTPPWSCSSAPRRSSSARASSRAPTRPASPGPSSRPPPTTGMPRSWPRSAGVSATPCGARRPGRSRPSSVGAGLVGDR